MPEKKGSFCKTRWAVCTLSLIPRCSRGRRGCLVHTVCTCMCLISKNSGKIGYSCILPWNADVTWQFGHVACMSKWASVQSKDRARNNCECSKLNLSCHVWLSLVHRLSLLFPSVFPMAFSSCKCLKSLSRWGSTRPWRQFFDGHDVFVWLPTGYGKSLRCQVLPFLMYFKKGHYFLSTCWFSAVCRLSNTNFAPFTIVNYFSNLCSQESAVWVKQLSLQ